MYPRIWIQKRGTAVIAMTWLVGLREEEQWKEEFGQVDFSAPDGLGGDGGARV